MTIKSIQSNPPKRRLTASPPQDRKHISSGLQKEKSSHDILFSITIRVSIYCIHRSSIPYHLSPFPNDTTT